MLYESCVLEPPFKAADMKGLYKQVIKGEYPRPPREFSNELCDVIKSMLRVNPSTRPNCE